MAKKKSKLAARPEKEIAENVPLITDRDVEMEAQSEMDAQPEPESEPSSEPLNGQVKWVALKNIRAGKRFERGSEIPQELVTQQMIDAKLVEARSE
jgi:hypothetical protein